jgi:hypothetical protein
MSGAQPKRSQALEEARFMTVPSASTATSAHVPQTADRERDGGCGEASP